MSEFYYANVDNSLLSKYDEITLQISNNKYDVLTFTEVKPKHGTLPDQSTLNIPGYILFTSDLDQPNSRGVVIYIKEQFQAKVVQPTIGTIFYDAIWTSIKGAENATLLLGCIYRSSTPATAIPRDVALHEAILWSANHSGFSHKLLVGDFNHPPHNGLRHLTYQKTFHLEAQPTHSWTVLEISFSSNT